MGNKEFFAEWSKYGNEDEEIASIAIDAGGPANQICFHCQQLAEKYLKGFLSFHNKRFERSHHLDYLLNLCEAIDKSFLELTDPVKYLTDFYLETRYPGDIPEFTLSQAKQAFKFSLIVKDFVLDKIK